MNPTQPSIGVFITDTHLVIRSWDPWLARATGIGAEQARGRSLAALFPDLETRGLLRRLERVIADGVVEVLAPALHHYLIRCAPLAPTRHFAFMQQRVTMAPLRDGDQLIGAIVSIEDVTDRLEHEQDLAGEQAAPPAATVQALTGALRDDDWRVRRAAAGGLAQGATPDVVDTLLRALHDEYHNLNVVNSALQTLAMLDVDTVSPLVAFLDDPDAELRTYAALALGSQKDQRAAPALLRALEDADANVRYHAIEALGRLRAAAAVEPLIEIAESRDFFLAFPALDALAQIGDPRVATRIVPLLEDDLLRGAAVEALGHLGDEEIVGPLTALLNKPAAPAGAVTQALVRLHDRYQKHYQEGAYIADQVRCAVDSVGIQNLLDALAAAGDEEARHLVRVVGWLEGPSVDRALAGLLSVPNVRKEVIAALVRHGAQVTDLLVGQLAAEDLETRQAAVIALGRIGDPRAVPELTHILTTDAELMVIAAGALARIGDPRPFEALIGLMSHPEMAVRQAVTSALNSLGHPDMVTRIVDLLTSPEPTVRESAVRVAGYFGYPQCVDLLLGACRDADESVRRAAIEHIAYLDDPRALPVLLEALSHETSRVRTSAARGLVHFRPAMAVPPLLAALDDPDPWVRYAAARTLGQHRSPEAVEPLARVAARDPAMHVRVAAVEALGQVGGGRVVATLAPLVEAQERDLAEVALRALGQVAHPDALAPLLAALRSPDPVRRANAARALGERGGPGAVDALQWTAAADTEWPVVQAAIDALRSLGTSEAIAALIELTTDPERRDACISALAGAGKVQLEDLARGLTHPQLAVRRAVVAALAQMRRPEASDLLGQTLEHPDPQVRIAVCNALASLGSRRAERKLAVLAHTDPDAGVRAAAVKALRR